MDDLLERAALDLRRAQHAIALTGAGISTESGIPDFRGPSGVWTKDPAAERRAFQSYDRFRRDPTGWWQERLTTPSLLGDLASAAPNAGHLALAELETMGVLCCVITQNVDGLHERAGSQHLLEYHGSAFKLRCVECMARFPAGSIDVARLADEGRLPPRCPHCHGIVKIDTVSFGEPIPSDVAMASLEHAELCDVMLICGTSATVYPFASLPDVARERVSRGQRHAGPGGARNRDVTIVEINAEPTRLTYDRVSDYFLQGKTGEILPMLVEAVRRAGA